MKNYRPVNMAVWQGRVDDHEDPEAFRFHQVVRKLDLRSSAPPSDKGDINFCLLGFHSDLGVCKNLGREGAARAPEFIRREMCNLPVFFPPDVRLYDGGDILPLDDCLGMVQEVLASLVRRILDMGLFPIILGGGHELAYGHFNGIFDQLENRGEIGIINLDAHFDLRPHQVTGPNSGTMFDQIAQDMREENQEFHYMALGIQESANTIGLFRRARELGVDFLRAKEIVHMPESDLLERIDRFMADVDHVYLTLCADVFSSAFAPGVSSPQQLGLNPETVLTMVKHIAASKKIKGFDIAEILPRFDTDSRTAKLAAIAIFAFINSRIGEKKLQS